MSEKEPGFSAAPKDERDEVAKLRRQLERAEFDLDQKTKFGKYDVTVPNEGEVTYEEYLAQRPDEGIIRDGEQFRDAKSGNFASGDAYNEQNGSSQDYYDRIGGLVNDGEYELPNLEGLGLLQLAKEAAKARQLGDPIEESRIRDAVDHYLTMDAMRDETESPVVAQARYEAEFERYDALVAKFTDRGIGASAGENHSPADGEGDASKRAEGASKPASAEGSDDSSEDAGETSGESEDEKGEGSDDAEKGSEAGEDAGEKPKAEPEVRLGDEKVTINEVYVSASGGKKVEVVGEDGTVRLVDESELTFIEPEPETSAESDADKPGDDASEEEGEKSDDEKADKDDTEKEGDEKEKKSDRSKLDAADQAKKAAEAKAKNADEGEAEDSEETEKSKFNKVKDWFKKERAKIQEFGGKAYWSARWEQSRDKVLNIGVTEEMTEEEAEKKRKRNRVAAIAGVAVLGAGATIAVFYGIAHLGHEHAQGAQDALNNGSGTGAENGAGSGNSGMDQDLRDVLDGNGSHSGDGELPVDPNAAAEAAGNIDPSLFNIQPNGIGGEELFGDMGIDPSKWYDVEDQLLANFGDNFYRMDDGHVGLLAGSLPQGARDIISNLK